MEKDVQVCLAGGEAERRFAGRANLLGSGPDRCAAIDLLSFFEGDVYEKPGRGKQEGFRTYFRLLRIWSRRLVTNRRNWTKVEAVARLLLEKETISGTETVAAMQDAVQRAIDLEVKKSQVREEKTGGQRAR
ncbi:MAG TPA: hypothetical protein VGQ75_10355 [Thermoanaerobaculia bacterium]|nr:hypothetical protein [Thermoanaerobaculia bacterium]